MNRPINRRGARRALLTLGAAAAATAIVLTGCTGTPPQDDSTPPAGGDTSELRVAIKAFPSSWDQDFVAFDSIALMLNKNVYPYFIDYGVAELGGGLVMDTENMIPTWAESFTSEDGKDWTLVLREGAVFPSGNPMTSADVKWSKERAFAANANVAGVYRLIGLTDPDQIEIVDERTVIFHQDWPSALTEQIQAIGGFLYDSVLLQEKATAADPWAQDWVAQNPADGGYYIVSDFTPGQEIVLTRNPDYPGENASKVETVRLTVVPNSASAAVLLRQGDVDLAVGLGANEIADLEGAEGVNIISTPSPTMVALVMNTAVGPLVDPVVRQAIASAIPYDQIVSTVYGGAARLPRSVLPIDMPGHIEGSFPYDTDVAEAERLIAQAGAAGLSFELAYPAEDTAFEQIAILIQSSLAEVGITVQLLPLDPGTFGERRAAKDLDMQITLSNNWVNDPVWLANNQLVTGAFLNYAQYSNPKVDELVNTAKMSSDAAERNALWKTLQEELARDVPLIPITQPNYLLPVRSNVSGFVLPLDGLIRFNNFTID